jgi:hypothetical protein
MQMQNNLTELVFIIDQSGSMHDLENDTIGGFNSMLSEQKGVQGDALVTTVLFNDNYELLHHRDSIQSVTPLTKKDYMAQGRTALLDALGRTIKRVRKAQKDTPTEKVLFVIITDGYENASRKYSLKKVKARIEKQKEEYGWEFIFFGANMDAISEAGKLGIDADNAVEWTATPVGTMAAFAGISARFTHFRQESSEEEKSSESK